MKRAFVLALLLWGGTASAKPALSDVPAIRDGLIVVGIAYEISEVCDSLDGRTFRGIRYLLRLKGMARDMGYSEDEINEFTTSGPQKTKLENMARGILARMGAVEGQPESYCTVGRAEIAKNTPIGQLLR